MSVTIELTGGEQLTDYLVELPEKMMERVVRRSLYAGISKIQDEARKDAPVLAVAGQGPHYPGELRDNIRVSTGRRGDVMRARCGITPEAFYGRFLEFGTRHAPAYPFMRPAADAASGAAAQQVIDTATENCRTELGTAAT
ncbi:MAG TPA: HK97-gp10 family putative phage morphogenesis protein [Scandinavium sp.]|jgi:HK97 gp10 family phage protein|uniref:HK97-gp10 family putative phage morphogenesis protein n=1 Tax=Scandinavium sp. TaxID=2830653 RepID=UPI002E2F8738|nr:HK97-gp10 family putative phage morphogenesis protein [Scandinavium sp.]HEX4499854.1 HK97-gp10 family putative phage morphogenesis protein [Scandinavium sp.]